MSSGRTSWRMSSHGQPDLNSREIEPRFRRGVEGKRYERMEREWEEYCSTRFYPSTAFPFLMLCRCQLGQLVFCWFNATVLYYPCSCVFFLRIPFGNTCTHSVAIPWLHAVCNGLVETWFEWNLSPLWLAHRQCLQFPFEFFWFSAQFCELRFGTSIQFALSCGWKISATWRARHLNARRGQQNRSVTWSSDKA